MLRVKLAHGGGVVGSWCPTRYASGQGDENVGQRSGPGERAMPPIEVVGALYFLLTTNFVCRKYDVANFCPPSILQSFSDVSSRSDRFTAQLILQ